MDDADGEPWLAYDSIAWFGGSRIATIMRGAACGLVAAMVAVLGISREARGTDSMKPEETRDSHASSPEARQPTQHFLAIVKDYSHCQPEIHLDSCLPI